MKECKLNKQLADDSGTCVDQICSGISNGKAMVKNRKEKMEIKLETRKKNLSYICQLLHLMRLGLTLVCLWASFFKFESAVLTGPIYGIYDMCDSETAIIIRGNTTSLQ